MKIELDVDVEGLTDDERNAAVEKVKKTAEDEFTGLTDSNVEEPNPHSQLVAHAMAEFERTGLDPSEFPNNMLLALVQTFSTQGHSGDSADWTRVMFNHLAQYDALPMLNAGAVDEPQA